MEYLFDPDRPHFKMWITLYDVDTKPISPATFYLFCDFRKSAAAPLYYAALCGFHDIVEHLITEYPQDVNASGGYYVRPVVAALAGEHFQTADLLRCNGAEPRVQGYGKWTPLHSAAYYGNLKVVQKLIEYDADISAEDLDGFTPLCLASEGIYLKDRTVLRLLLERGADVNARTTVGSTPLHRASSWGALEIVRLLLEHGADVEAEDDDGKTALEFVGDAPKGSENQGRRDEIERLLLEYKAK